MTSSRRVVILAGASGGGHWIELLRLRPAFAGFDVVYISTFENYASVVPESRFHAVPDASRFSVAAFLPIVARAFRIIRDEKPSAIITTGSAPMLPFVLLGRLLGVKSLWIDSISSTEHLSMSGRIAKHIATKVIAQWPALAAEQDIDFWGKVI
ncbi:oligosaccharide biosynthesis protein Alg14 [Sphingomonas faeni]|uniref:oligosaccharide biosynthesis protein Alg14 n=1 Tax=Sphingomonas faeni TaxID=185950 RepID=UPI000D373416|nr:oligosaccharide biosynthesis protein Alg14 [Sphingomonas faeni]